MYHVLDARIRRTLAEHIRQRYASDLVVVTERPRRIEMGEVATPVCFELAKRLKRAPRQIAQEIAGELPSIEGVERVEIAGGGYVNFHFLRAAFFAQTVAGAHTAPPAVSLDAPKCIVEHTNINPNKAAHIGHLRNAALGDTLVRLLRRAGHRVEVQNYIDDTGVQVADVVVGFLHMERMSAAEVSALAARPKFDYYCWDLYARVTSFLDEDQTRLDLRAETLRSIEEGLGEPAEMAEIISAAIVRCHLQTMERLRIEYDLLPRESDILHLKFWEAAFALLRQKDAIHMATSGKNAGCWVMHLNNAGEKAGPEDEEDDAKVIVRSNDTVTYVGKDIAYQLWKFGLLGRDFYYTRFHTYPDGRTLWSTVSRGGESGSPVFGGAATVYNVIDARQSYLQNVVVAGLRALGFAEQADHSIHFSYEIVALTPRCASEMGYTLSGEDANRPYVEVSGRKGLGVKADDLLDRLEAAARVEVDQRHPATAESERAAIAHAIAIGALRYFLLKYTRTALIAFDFKDALSFEGETGPYCQYAVVRARNIARESQKKYPQYSVEELAGQIPGDAITRYLRPGHLSGQESDNTIWELVLLAGSLDFAVEAAIGAQEPAFIAKYAFHLAQAFNNFYHKHHILSTGETALRAFLLTMNKLIERQLVAALQLLGIESPEKM